MCFELRKDSCCFLLLFFFGGGGGGGLGIFKLRLVAAGSSEPLATSNPDRALYPAIFCNLPKTSLFLRLHQVGAKGDVPPLSYSSLQV